MTSISIDQAMQIALQHHQAGRLTEAEAIYRQILTQDPKQANALQFLGVLLGQTGRHQAAEEMLRRAIAVAPDVAQTHSNLGVALKEQGRLDEAAEAHAQALALRPDFAGAHHNLGAVWQAKGEMDQAIAAYRRAIEVQPDYANAYVDLGDALRQTGKYDEAIDITRRGIALRPDLAGAHNNLAVALQAVGRLDEAAAEFQRTLQLNNDYPEAHFNYSQLLLLRGDFTNGWREYGWLWRSRHAPRSAHTMPQPLWDGTALRGRKIFLYHDQGVGDAIQFVRYLPMVTQRGGRLIVACRPDLRRLLEKQMPVEEWVAADAAPVTDVQCPLPCLPGLLATTLANIPASVPYLHALPDDIQKWQSRTGGTGLKVGLEWSGDAPNPMNPESALSLDRLEPLAAIEGVRFFSLQKGPAAAEAAHPPPGMFLMNLAPQLGDFADTAGLIANLDLVITTDSAVAHLAGAMGKQVWTMLSHIPEWRWMLEREDSPWYPTMRLFRQPKPGDWDSVIASVAHALDQRAHAYYVRRRGTIIGPLDLEELRNMARIGALSAGDLLSSDRRTWKAASEIEDLAPILRASRARPAPRRRLLPSSRPPLQPDDPEHAEALQHQAATRRPRRVLEELPPSPSASQPSEKRGRALLVAAIVIAVLLAVGVGILLINMQHGRPADTRPPNIAGLGSPATPADITPAIAVPEPPVAPQPLARDLALDLGNSVSMKLVLIPAGTFLMGSPATEQGRGKDEVQHEVTISQPFYMAATDVTVDQFAAFVKDVGYKTDAEKDGWSGGFDIRGSHIIVREMNSASWLNPGFPQMGDHPVVQVSWNDAKAFCDWLSRKNGKTVALPTEAQWEYTCRAGTKTAYPWGDSPDYGKGWANCADQNLKKRSINVPAGGTFFNWDDGFAYTSPVGSFHANTLGLYDMIGNVWQWCQDFYGDYDKGGATDPMGSDEGGPHVLRGGSWSDGPAYCRAARRNWGDVAWWGDRGGFRVVVSSSARANALQSQEARLGYIDAGVPSPVFSRDGCHLAYATQRGPKMCVVVDGQAGTGYDAIAKASVIFSPDSRRVAYMAQDGDKQLVVVDGQAGAAYDAITEGSLAFSPDSNRVVYQASKGAKRLVVVDAQAGAEYDYIGDGSIVFSPDSQHVAYAARKDDKWVVVLDAQESDEFEGLGSTLVFSADSQRLAYVAQKGPKQALVVDGHAGPEFDAISKGTTLFSPDSKRVAYAARQEDKWLVVTDGRPGEEYDQIEQGTPNFSSDSKRMVYAAQKGSKWVVVVDGQAGQQYDGVGALIFSPTGKSVAYGAGNGAKQLVVIDGQPGEEYDGIFEGTLIFSPDSHRVAYAAKRGDKQVEVVMDAEAGQFAGPPPWSDRNRWVADGQTGAEYDGISASVFSPDSGRVAYAAKQGAKWLMVLDGQPSEEYDGLGGTVFSPDSRRVAYSAARGGKWFVVQDGQPGESYGAVGSPLFSPDSKRMAYVAKKGQKQVIVVDGRAGAEYDGIFKKGPTFRADGVLEYLAIKDNSLYRVTQLPGP